MLEVSTNYPVYSWTNITTGIGTTVQTVAAPTSTVPGKATKLQFHSLIFNNAGSNWEVDLYDGTSSSGTSIGKLRGIANPTQFFYDLNLVSGLFIDTVKGTTVGDLTVTYRVE